MTTTIVASHGRYDIDDVPFAFGGRASLFRVVNSHLALKRFREPLPLSDSRRLERLVHEGREQFISRSSVMGTAPGAAINWPVDLVAGRDGVTGVVLPLVPGDFMRAGSSLRTMEFLILRRGEPPVAHQRVAVLIRLAETLAWLGDRGLVHGDVSPRNVVWSVDSMPKVILLDVDGIHDAATPSAEAVMTPGWSDPRVLDKLTKAHDLHSDWYALALFIYRGLFVTPGMLRKGPDGWPRPALPERFAPRVLSLLHRGLDRPLDHAARPHPREWVTALVDEFYPGQANHASLRALDDLVRARATSDAGAQWRASQPAHRTAASSPAFTPVVVAPAKPIPPRRPLIRRLFFRPT